MSCELGVVTGAWGSCAEEGKGYGAVSESEGKVSGGKSFGGGAKLIPYLTLTMPVRLALALALNCIGVYDYRHLISIIKGGRVC